ncbi:hypothetical protein L6452_40455 [Arctium lappa]|uniref:Uncharacterized protein n=1 Tax=Arctium lappa TaxID=4217 RepID=A0ACB8XNR3_ARCLA|nr:hypothetical protein L6452_40455 [Arctium lappa]
MESMAAMNKIGGSKKWSQSFRDVVKETGGNDGDVKENLTIEHEALAVGIRTATEEEEESDILSEWFEGVECEDDWCVDESVFEEKKKQDGRKDSNE